MAENTFKSNSFKKPEKEKKSKSKSKSWFSFEFFKDPRFSLAAGFFLIIVSLYLFTAFLSYLFTGKADQSVVEALWNTDIIESGKEAENWLGLYGAVTSHYMIFRWLGISAFFMPPMFFFLGFRMVFLEGNIFIERSAFSSHLHFLPSAGGSKHPLLAVKC